jgi:hypothetical protein
MSGIIKPITIAPMEKEQRAARRHATRRTENTEYGGPSSHCELRGARGGGDGGVLFLLLGLAGCFDSSTLWHPRLRPEAARVPLAVARSGVWVWV